MGIPFRDAEEIEALGAAAFLRIRAEPAPGAYQGALFLVNARGEPLEFAYNRIVLPQPFLWTAGAGSAYAARRLATSLFEICPRAPSLILALATEVGSALFVRELDLALPVARLARGAVAPGDGEDAEAAAGGGTLLWAGRRPAPESAARRLLERLGGRGMLAEPFERAAAGLAEVYRPGDAGEEERGELVERADGR